MKLKQVPAKRGAIWVRQGFAAFMLRPIAFSSLFTLFVFYFFVTLLVPFVGPLLLLVSLPLVTLGFMIATQRALKGVLPMPTVFIEPLRRSRAQTVALFRLGLIYAVSLFLIVTLIDVLDGGKFQAFQEALASGKPEAVEPMLVDTALLFSILLRMGLTSLLSVPFWHAPTLVHWGGMGAGKALFASTVACWRNKGAFLLFGLAWTALIMLVSVAINLLMVVLRQPQGVALMAVPAALMFTTVFYTSLFFTFADCFDVPPTPSPSPSV